MSRILEKARAIIDLTIAPARFVRTALAHDRALVDDVPISTDEASTWRRTRVIRRSYARGLGLVAVTLVVGGLAGRAMARWVAPATAELVMGLQLLSAAILLGATVSLLGWEIASWKGQTFPEKVNRWLYRSMYAIGTAVLTFSLAWQGSRLSAVAIVSTDPSNSSSTWFAWVIEHGVDILALTVAGLVLYKEFLERARISVALGPDLDAVFSASSGACEKVHSYVVLANRSRNMGVVEKIDLLLRSPSGATSLLEWDLFFTTVSSKKRDDESVPIPVPVPGNSTVLKGIQFRATTGLAWTVGRYELRAVAQYAGGALGRRRVKVHSAYWLEIDGSVLSGLTSASSHAKVSQQPSWHPIKLRS